MTNSIVLENQKEGTPESEWMPTGPGSDNIEGFATDISANQGDWVDFKINTDATEYWIDIYRLGYYGGDGARLMETIHHVSDFGEIQPDPIRDESINLVDAGNWYVTDSWEVPEDAVSGVYIAKLIRGDGVYGENLIPFIVRDDGGTSDIVFQTSDTTWQAYNAWGESSLYTDRAEAVSYNRPIETPSGPDETTSSGPWNFIFGAEYSAIRWLEKNGYDVSYISGVDTARYGDELLNHKAFLSVGHDEYWSGEQRANVEAARDAGVNLQFWSGNEVFWKTEWLPSIDGSGTDYRTMVTYKTTSTGLENPSGVWTGTWRDPAGGEAPENALTGTMYMVDWDHTNPIHYITIPSEYGDLRIWQNTDIANLQDGESYTTSGQYLGYEWDWDVDNGYRPAGLIDLSSTTVNTNAIYVENPCEGCAGGICGICGASLATGDATHNLTLYRAESGALVFGAGTVFWSWALDDHHMPGPDGYGADALADLNIQQAMVNLFADMGIQPETLDFSLALATQSTDFDAPRSTIETVAAGQFQVGQSATISGTAYDNGGGVVAGIEVSTNGGASWHRAAGTTDWSYTWTPNGASSYTILSRATDDSVNTERPALGNFTIADFLHDFSSAQGWKTTDTPRLLADVNGDGKADLVGFGDASTFVVRGTDGSPFDPLPQFSATGFDVVIDDLTVGQGYDASRLRGIEYVGNFTPDPDNHFATFWAQADDGILYYVATSAENGVDPYGETYTTPIFDTEARHYGDFSIPQGWSEHYNVDIAFVSTGEGALPADTYASLLGFGEAGLLVGPQAFGPTATADQVYVASGSETFGNAAGWDSTVDVRAVRDYNGNEIDLNQDGIVDVVAMGPEGLRYAMGAYADGAYSLGASQLAPINASGSGSDFGAAQGWSNDSTLRYIADLNNDGHVDIIGFGEPGVFVSLGQMPNADGSGAFGQTYLAFDDLGSENGWSNDANVRLLGDVNGDGLIDIVGFGLDYTFVATASADPNTGNLTWAMTDSLNAYAYSQGFRNDANLREVADINGDGIADIIVSGSDNTHIVTHQDFGIA